MKLEDFKPGMWIRSKFEPHIGRAFVLFVHDDKSVTYHLERPYCAHPRLSPGWTTGGTIYEAGFDNWEPANLARPEEGRSEIPLLPNGTVLVKEALLTDGKAISQAWRVFAASDLGKQLLDGEAHGKYLANRLEASFISGWNALAVKSRSRQHRQRRE